MADVKIEIRANGPNRVTGPIEIVDQSGNNYSVPEGAVGFPVPLRGVRQQALLRWRPSGRRLSGRKPGPLA